MSGDSHCSSSRYIPPWTQPYIIGVAGCSGSGKTSVAQMIIEEINQPWTVLLSLDNFYKSLSPEMSAKAFANDYDFDKPDALDLDLLFKCVQELRNGRKAEIPVYSFAHHQRTERTTTIYGANVIIIEGIYALYNPDLLELMDTKVYVDTDLDICLARRLNRDIVHRGRDLEGILKQWHRFVKPNSERFVIPTISSADVVIPRGADNTVGIDMLTKHINKQLDIKSREHLSHLEMLSQSTEALNYENVTILEETNQLKVINTTLFDRECDRTEFIFFFDRIAILLINAGLEFLDCRESEIRYTPGNHAYRFMEQLHAVVAVSIIRSGDCFMDSLKKTFPELTVGKLLIQQDTHTGEPRLHTERLPDIAGRKVFLLDAQIVSGSAAIMAVQVLVDHGVAEADIVLVCYLATKVGIKRILRAFGGIAIVIGKQQSDEQGSSFFKSRFIDAQYFGTS
ncbi:unnamed protein product [Kuraishia capsulata CBS 1993]|uniref:Uridine kinase n=1 Tax=Kuraishia capsulata CBS 1993 TaxID=1382522 RepID=W6MNL9_9ASCO|nr:uncharacterized protein KUCA_T00002620001 [Kuraishia capsulata CBS 1993]CDK26647.1 unnamed protein product [Kuraishia capsulata CBS 1993]